MKILLVGDKESKYIYDYFDYERFKEVDFIISTGDLRSAYLSYLVTMLNVPLYYVPGNHDRGYLEHEPEGCVNIDGKLVRHGNLRIFGLGGSMQYNMGPYQYTDKEMAKRFQKNRFGLFLNGGIDIFVTHAPAYHINDGEDQCHRGFKVYLDILNRYNPSFYIHGHQHLNYGHNHTRILNFNQTWIINSFEYYYFDTENPDRMI